MDMNNFEELDENDLLSIDGGIAPIVAVGAGVIFGIGFIVGFVQEAF